MTSPKVEAERIRAGWKQLDERLAKGLPKAVRALRAGLSSKALDEADDLCTQAWFAAHDGQTGKTEVVPGHRFLSWAEAQRRRKRARGASTRADWDDSWVVLAEAGKNLICFDTSRLHVYEVDVSKPRYAKRRIATALSGWLEDQAKALGGAGPSAAKSASTKDKGTKAAPAKAPAPVKAPPASASVDACWEAIEAFAAAHSDANIRLEKGAEKSALSQAQATLGHPLHADLVGLLQKHDGQAARSAPLFGSWTLLGTARAAQEHRRMLALAKKLKDAAFYDARWWPFASDGAGNLLVLAAPSFAVLEVLQDPYRRKRIAAGPRAWLAAETRKLCSGAYL